jgi:hypothetical protein
VAFTPSARALTKLPGANLSDPMVLPAITGVLAAITVLACAGPVRRADTISSAATLRQD